MKTKICNTCKKEHKTPAELTFVGVDKIGSYWNCTCGSTLILTPYNEKQIEEILRKLME